jgi:hypothetical protein
MYRLSYILRNIYPQARKLRNNPADAVPDSTHHVVSKRFRLRFQRSGLEGSCLASGRLTAAGNRVSRVSGARAPMVRDGRQLIG